MDESIRIHCEYNKRVWKHLSLVMNSSHSGILSNIRHLDYQSAGDLSIRIKPTLTTLKICNADLIELYTSESAVMASLHTLELIDTCMLDKLFAVFYNESLPSNLARLVLRDIPYAGMKGSKKMIAVLRDHSPKLEYLEITNLTQTSMYRLAQLLPALSDLRSLKTLRVDLKLLVSPEDPSALLQLHMGLPPNLATLELSYFDICTLADMAVDQGMISDTTTDIAAEALVEMVSTTSIKILSITLTPESDAAAVQERPYLTPFLYVLANELYDKKKIEFEVILHDGNVLVLDSQVSPEAE